MNQIDFVGGLPPMTAAQFKDIRNTRPTVAEEKAALCLELGRLCTKPPESVANGGIELTRRWVAAQKTSLALARNSRASVVALSLAIKTMRGYLA
jgi:hypothetical protein